MKLTHKAGHSYDQFHGQRDTSESKHFETINHFQQKRSADWKKKTPEEKAALKKAIQAYPTKHRAPVKVPTFRKAA